MFYVGGAAPKDPLIQTAPGFMLIARVLPAGAGTSMLAAENHKNSGPSTARRGTRP